MENLSVIPFGKYKGQPIEVLQSDKQYADWLMQQDWFKEKYTTFQTLIINNFNAPQDSPEHNRLAELFLNDEFCWKLFSFCGASVTKKYNKRKYNHILPNSTHTIPCNIVSVEDKGWQVIERKFELKDGSDVCIEIVKIHEISYNVMVGDYDAPKSRCKNLILAYDFNRFGIYPLSGILVPVFEIDSIWSVATIEIKPVVGDDYPTVIRQCRAQKSKVLFIGKYKSTVLPIESFRKMFPDIQIVLLSDIQ
jgi:hypothetical protein